MNESKYKIGDRIILRCTPPEEPFDTIVDEIIGLWHEGDRVKYQIVDRFDIFDGWCPESEILGKHAI